MAEPAALESRDPRLTPVAVYNPDGSEVPPSALEAAVESREANLLHAILVELRTIRFGIQVLCGPFSIADPGPPPS